MDTLSCPCTSTRFGMPALHNVKGCETDCANVSVSGPPIDASIYQIMREASLLFCLPSNPFYTPKSGHAVQEAAYANVGWIFA